MKYKYLDKHGRLIAESDTAIKFNTELFPIWKDLKPVIDKPVKTQSKRSWEKEDNK